MPWVRLDDGFDEHPKLLQVGPLGLAVQIRALCYCSRQLTDGFVPDNAVTILLHGVTDHNAVVDSLVKAGLWIRRNEGPGGYDIKDYLDYNPSRERVMAARKSNAVRQKEHRQRAKKLAKDPRVSPPRRNADRNAPVTTPPSPSPVKRTPPTPPKARRADLKFETFWKAYPRKVGRPVALKAFDKIKPDDELLGVMLSALAKQRRWPTWTKDYGQFIPHPSTWLNQERWNDQPPEVGGGEVRYVED